MAEAKKQSGGSGCLGLIVIGVAGYFVMHGLHIGSTPKQYTSAQIRADFRQYVGQVNGVLGECDNATNVAKKTLQSVANGGRHAPGLPKR